MKTNELCVNNLRVLSCDVINNAKGGHSGIALSAAPIMYALYSNALDINPKNPTSFFRDRFVLSAGHGSALLYAALHMFGYDISINDLKKFRQLGSITPGHPEMRTPGVDCATGPLGQGVASAVGMAIAERFLAEKFNKPDINLIDNYTYALVGDGCLMEGVSSEALSLAGTLKLNKLIVLYDANKSSMDSTTNITFTQNTRKVYEGFGFNVIDVKNGNSVEDITAAISDAKKESKPTLIIVHTSIGYGTRNEGSPNAHNFILTADDLSELKNTFGIIDKPFEIIPMVQKEVKRSLSRYSECQKKWTKKTREYEKKYKTDYIKLQRFLGNDFSGVTTILEGLTADKEISIRDSGHIILNEICKYYENIIGGTADVSRSTKAFVSDSDKFNLNSKGRNIFYGVREFGMSAISNGISLYGGLRAFASTFAIFSDYLKPALRMSAIMKQPVMYIFSHDGLDGGGDGPTHQPVEQLTSLRATPNLYTFKPADFNETKAAYSYALNSEYPTAIFEGRNTVKNHENKVRDVLKGGYVLSYEKKGKLDGILLSCGSELELALDTQKELLNKGKNVRVVSMPCTKLFEEQLESYQNKVLPKDVKILVIEIGSELSWGKYIARGGSVCMSSFGESAPVKVLKEHFNFDIKDIMKVAKEVFK